MFHKDLERQRGRPDTFALQRTGIVYQLFNDQVTAVECNFPASAFHTMVEAMTIKYGKPVLENKAVQRPNQPIDSPPAAYWTDSHGDRIVFVSSSEKDPLTASLKFVSAEVIAWRIKRAQESKRAAAKDM